MYVNHMNAIASDSQKMTSEPQELDLEVVKSHYIGVENQNYQTRHSEYGW